jgi:uncharacterized protein YfcZ (UPF0381/DUF406 family)
MKDVFILYGYYTTTTNENPEFEILGVFDTEQKARDVIAIWEDLSKNTYSEGYEVQKIKINNPELPPMYNIGG